MTHDTKQAQATARPWSKRTEVYGYTVRAHEHTSNEVIIARVENGAVKDEANAALIVRAVNAHDELMEHGTTLLRYHESPPMGIGERVELSDAIAGMRAAVRAARGES